MTGRTLLVTTVKDEGPFLWEWVAYHRAIGFDDILVYENDSTDRTKRILRHLDEVGAIRAFANPTPNRTWQNRAYRRASHEREYAEAEWCMALDADEFLTVKAGGGRVSDLVVTLDDADVMLVNWRMFGASGQATLTEDLVLERFTRTEAEGRIDGGRLTGYKTLFRTRAYQRPGIHNPKVPLIEGARWINGSGLPMGQFPHKGWRSMDPGRRALAQVNHYKVRDLESFLVKSLRGSASHPDRLVEVKYWQKANRSEAVDTSIQRMLPAVRAEMARLDEATGGRLSTLRRAAIAKYRARAAALMEDPETAALMRTLRKLLEVEGESEVDAV